MLDNLWCIDRPINKLNINKTINKLNNETWDRWYFIYQIVLIIIIVGLCGVVWNREIVASIYEYQWRIKITVK